MCACRISTDSRSFGGCEPECRRPLRLVLAAEAGGAGVDSNGARRRLCARAVMARSLQARSIVAAAVAILLALVVVGVGTDLLVGRHLRSSLDRSLRERAVEVAQLSASAPALLRSPGSLDAPLGGEQLDVEVVDRRGRIVARSLALGGRVLPVEGIVRAVVAGGLDRYA